MTTNPSTPQTELVAGLRLNLTAREMREVVSGQAREQERGFRRSQSREESKMSFKAVFSTLIGPGPTRLGSHWSRATE